MPLATLSIDIEARLAGLQEGFDKAARLAQKNADASAASWQRAGAVIAGIGATVAGAFAGFSLVDLVRRNIDALDALNDVADATGASIENISALEDLAKRTGTTLDVVTTSLVKLNGSLADAKPGSPVALALKGIGLEAEKLKSLDPAEALRQVAVALSGYADDGNKARLVQELFGKSLREVAPLLKDLAEKTTLVGTATSEQAAQAEKFNKQLFELQTNSANAARALAAELLPALNGIFDSVKRNGGVWAAWVEGFKINWNIAQANDAQAAIKAAVAQLEKLQALPARTIFQEARVRELREEIAVLMRDAAAAAEALKTLGNGGKPVAPKTRSEMEAEARRFDKSTYERWSVGDGDKTKAVSKPAEISDAQRALASYVAELERELDKVEQLSEREKALNVLRSLGAAGEIPQVRELVLGLERQVTLGKQDNAIRADKLRIAKEQEAADRAIADELYRLSGRADDDRKAKMTAALEQQIADGVVYTPEELDRLSKAIGGVADYGKQQFAELDELTKQFGRNVQNALGDTLKSTLKGDFDNILSLWGNLLVEMASQAAAAQIGKTLFGDLFKGGDLGGVLGDVVFSLSGGFTGFAAGGDHSGGFRIVGENGPELEATGPARIFNADQTRRILRGGAGDTRSVSVTYAPVIQVDARADRAQSLAEAQALVDRGHRDLLSMLHAKGVV